MGSVSEKGVYWLPGVTAPHRQYGLHYLAFRYQIKSNQMLSETDDIQLSNGFVCSSVELTLLKVLPSDEKSAV
jgi:hypothetical protein